MKFIIHIVQSLFITWLLPLTITTQTVASEHPSQVDDSLAVPAVPVNLTQQIEDKTSQELSQNDETSSDSTAEGEVTQTPKYIISPRIAPDERINPFTTTLPLNETPISHLTEWEFTAGTVFGEDITTQWRGNATIKLDSEIVESLTTDNIFIVEQTGTYLQLRTFENYEREVRTTFEEPQTLTGLELQLSLTGACPFLEAEPTDQCTYTPGIVTDRNSINPDFLVPTRVVQTSNVGDIVTPESLAVINAPGFGRGANGQEIGLDLFFPNAGSSPGNSQSNQTIISRTEKMTAAYGGTLSRVSQIVKANDRRAVLGRTIHGFTIISEEEDFIQNFGLQMVAQVLPIVDPEIEPGEGAFNPNINRNLFLAPNNVRLPAKSFTVYHGGIATANSLIPPVTSLSQVPNAQFDSVWFGFSPVIERSFETIIPGFRVTSPRRVVVSSGGEGGADANVDLTSVVNQDIFSTTNLKDFYAQVYLTITNQNVDSVRTNVFREETKFYPHVSITGDITGSDDVLRYYSGMIFAPDLKAYVGTDYTKSLSSGWRYTAGGIGYLNPDRDYYSQLWGSAAKTFQFTPQTNLTLSSGFNYAIDRDMLIGDIVSTSPASQLTAGLRFNWNNVSMGVLNYFGDVIPNSFEDTLITDLAVQVSENLRVSGFISPINENNSRARYGADLVWRLNEAYNSPSLVFSWVRNEYDYGNDVFGNDLLVEDNIFTVLFRMGSPENPFDPTTAERLRRQRNREGEELREDSRDRIRNFPSPEAQ